MSDYRPQHILGILPPFTGTIKGYRGRVRSSDFETKKQMQQLDKQRMADDQRQYNLVLNELTRRKGQRQAAKEQAEQIRQSQQAGAMFQDSRAKIAQQAEQAWQVQPIQPAPITGPSFPIPQPNYSTHRNRPPRPRTAGIGARGPPARTRL